MQMLDDLWAKMKEHWRISVLLISGLLALLLRDRMGSITFSSSLFYYGIFAVVILVGASMWNEWRYKTRQFVCYSLHASVKAPGIYPVGEWAVVPIGSIDAEGFSYEGGQGTVVVPRTSVEILPEFIVSWSRPVQTDLENLPTEVQTFVSGKRSFGGPYQFTMTNLRPSSIDEVYREIVGHFKNPGNLSQEDLKAKLNDIGTKVDAKLADIEKKYNKEVTTHDEKFKEQQGVITTLDQLLAQAFKGGKRVFDFVGSAQRSLRKKSLLDVVTKEKKGEETG